MLRVTLTLGGRSPPRSIASWVMNSGLPGGVAAVFHVNALACELNFDSISNNRQQTLPERFAFENSSNLNPPGPAARRSGLHCPLLSGRCHCSSTVASLIRGLDPLEVVAPVVTMKYGRAVVGGTRESTPDMNPASGTRSDCG